MTDPGDVLQDLAAAAVTIVVSVGIALRANRQLREHRRRRR